MKIKTCPKAFLILLVLCIQLQKGRAQSTLEFPFTSESWEFSGDYQILPYESYESVFFKKNDQGSLPDVKIKNGIIDFDIILKKVRGFAGIKFRMQDNQNYEEFYLRSHQSGNPDAMQYTPVYKGLAGWQLYHGENYSNAMSYQHDKWMHVRLAIFEDQMEVFINDMETPILHVFDLRRETQAGSVAIYGTNSSHFANLKIQPLESYTFKSPEKKLPELASNIIPAFRVSESFPAKQLEKTSILPQTELSKLAWKSLKSDPKGVANLAQIAQRSQQNNTCFAEILIQSDKDQVKEIQFGYSDRMRLYFKGKAIYQGQRTFRSRDYRYLGTIGFFDSVFLPLKKGENKIYAAVSENFGGWGIMFRVPDLSGISFSDIP